VSTAQDSIGDAEAVSAPMLRVVSGNPTAEELAVIIALTTARSSAPEVPPSPPRGGWADPERTIRRIRRPGLGAWRVGL
jgi:hypothetical protein